MFYNSKRNRDLPLHATDKAVVQTDEMLMKFVKESKNCLICRESNGNSFLGFLGCSAMDFLEKERTITEKYNVSLLDQLKIINLL